MFRKSSRELELRGGADHHDEWLTVARDRNCLTACGPLDPVSEARADLVGADRDGAVIDNGASRTRTGDLLSATQTLSQLSYSPSELNL